MDTADPLSAAILAALADAPGSDGVSLPRIAKRLGLSASVLLRHLSRMGDAVIGGQPGPGWVRVERVGERWMVALTAAGHEAAASAVPATAAVTSGG